MKQRLNHSSFCKIKCEKCKNEQLVFSNATTEVVCLVCGEILASPTGGVAAFRSQPLEQH
ncbi:30S ribosomal protein S27e [Candidatus Woesearchaeota archaeon]|nr:30S ribosomal protein S27e [Candidatus Woesearchaeota archaeon]